MRRTFFTSIIDKLWNVLTFRYFPVICLIAASALCFTTVLTSQPSQVSVAWWTIPLRNGQVVAALVLLGFFTIASWVTYQIDAAAKEKHRRANGKSSKEGESSRAQTLGFLVLMIGVATIAGDWFLAQRSVPPARVTMPSGRWLQSYPTQSTEFSTDVMLPSEVALKSVRPQEKVPVVDLQFRKSKDDNNPLQPVRVYEPLLVEGNYWTLIGTEYSLDSLRAVITPEVPNAIPAAGGVGDKLQFTVNGPKYEITSINFDDFPELGPYVQLKDEAGHFFNVFMKPDPKDQPNQVDTTPKFGHGFWLTSIEPAPLPTVMISPEPPFELLLPGLLIALVGLVLMIISSENSILLGVRCDTSSFVKVNPTSSPESPTTLTETNTVNDSTHSESKEEA